MHNKVKEILLSLLEERAKEQGDVMIFYDNDMVSKYVDKIMDLFRVIDKKRLSRFGEMI